MAVRLGWNDGHDPKDLLEQDVFAAVIPGPEQETFLEIQTSFKPIASQLEFGKTNFGFLAVRVSKAISAFFGGGTLTNTGNTALNGTAAAFLIAGYLLIRRGRTELHKRCMLAALATSTLFLTFYVIYHANVGSRPFAGTGPARRDVTVDATLAGRTDEGARMGWSLIGLAAVLLGVRVWSRVAMFNAGRMAEYELRNALLHKLQQLGPAFYGKMSSGEIMSRSTKIGRAHV